LSDTFRAWKAQGGIFVGHNFAKYDAPLFEKETARFGCPFEFDHDHVVDTGMLVKGAQLGLYMYEAETPREFYLRVCNVRSKVRWSLDRHCYTAYNLGSSGIKATDAHDAVTDCILTHTLLEVLRGKETEVRAWQTHPWKVAQ
jgi:hypothetical protein